MRINSVSFFLSKLELWISAFFYADITAVDSFSLLLSLGGPKRCCSFDFSSHFHRPNRPPSKNLTQNRQIRTFFVRTRGIGIPAETSFVLRCCTKNEAHHCLGSKVVQFLIPVWLLIRCGIFRLPTCFTNPLWFWIITTSVRESVALSKQLNRKWLSSSPEKKRLVR